RGSARRGAPPRAPPRGARGGGPSPPPRLHLDARAHVLERAAEHRQRVVAGSALDDPARPVDDPLRGALLAVAHDDAGEATHEPILVLRIGIDETPRNVASSRQVAAPRAPGAAPRIRTRAAGGASPDARPAA